MQEAYDYSAVAGYAETLKSVDGLILCFPHWWFSMPAMLKGWVDRVWGPGIAFDYDPKDKHLEPALHNIKLFGVVTSYGSPWWIVTLFAGNAGKKVLMRGMKPLCAKGVQLLLYGALRHGSFDRRQPPRLPGQGAAPYGADLESATGSSHPRAPFPPQSGS